MTSFSVEQKLRLASALREEQEKNQFSLRKRESILTGTPLKDFSHIDESGKVSITEDLNTSPSTFRIRFFLALILFVAFMWYDSGHIVLGDIDSAVICQRIQEDQISSVLDRIP